MTTIGEPKLDVRAAQPYMGIRTVTSFKGMSKRITEFNRELGRWMKEHGAQPTGVPFLRLHVIDMRGAMDLTVGVPVAVVLADDGKVKGGNLLTGRYASLIYSGGGIAGNRALIEWVRANGLEFDRWDSEQGDCFACRYKSYLTDPKIEPRKTHWQVEVAIKLTDDPQNNRLSHLIKRGRK